MMADQIPVPHIRPLSFAMELRVLINRQRRIMRKLEAEQKIYPDKRDDNGE